MGRLLCNVLASLGGLLVVLAGPAGAQPAGGDPAGLDADLLRQLEEAAREDRQAREARREAAAQERAAEAAARAEATRRAREAERAAAAPIEEAIADEQARQAALLEAVTGRGGRGAAPLPPPPEHDPGIADPRIAAQSPPLRSLPEEIFDRSEEVVPA
ncbi:MAG TPA: hypothetical protein ENO23_05670, partial [Alphaproteobacteria bacterium]|nr:hypothetical protein [Alphaproteobacteria bacterium]